eukprot:6194509-Pleurochrysis_carterae.AAC.1
MVGHSLLASNGREAESFEADVRILNELLNLWLLRGLKIYRSHATSNHPCSRNAHPYWDHLTAGAMNIQHTTGVAARTGYLLKSTDSTRQSV